MIVLHKPFDSLTLGTLMARDGWSPVSRHVVNGLFALAIPVGVLMLLTGLWQVSGTAWASWWMSLILAASTGMFLCIALSDLLPELQFHRHDRLKLSAALVLGLGLAWIMAALHADH
jgi:zinc and cadmium transporter